MADSPDGHEFRHRAVLRHDQSARRGELGRMLAARSRGTDRIDGGQGSRSHARVSGMAGYDPFVRLGLDRPLKARATPRIARLT